MESLENPMNHWKIHDSPELHCFFLNLSNTWWLKFTPLNQKNSKKNDTNLDQNILFKFWKWAIEWLVYKEMRIKYSILLQDFGVQKLSEWPEVQVEKVYPP